MPGVDLLPFFQGIYGGEPVPTGEVRYFCIATHRLPSKMHEKYFRWPEEVPQALAWINQMSTPDRPANVYYCVSLLTDQKRSRDFIQDTHCVWADLDDTPPVKLKLPPTYLVESSPGKYQGIWTLVEAVPYSTAEDFSRRVAYAHRADGADTCWDATRLLRVPGTFNMKYEVAGEGNPIVAISTATPVGYELDEIAAAYLPLDQIPNLPKSVELDWQAIEGVGSAPDVMARYHRTLPPETVALVFEACNPEQDWSAKLWALEMSCFEAGMDLHEVFVVAQGSGCNKYDRDGRPDSDLWKEVLRARESHERKAGMVLTTEEIEEIDLLTPEEIDAVGRQTPSFLDRYQAWATSRTDAPREFHIGGALIALSTVLSSLVEVQTAYGAVRPNIWVMLLSDSTISRKTTSMRLSEEIYGGVGDPLLATDGSMEGLITELAARPGQTSMFVRDEFTGLIAAAKKKDYMSDFLQALCGLYDGSRVKRRLRKETIEAKNPIFLLFAGGVETKLLEQLNQEDITSGFIPRFLPIFGRTAVKDLRLIGRAKPKDMVTKDGLIGELKAIQEQYSQLPSMLRVPGAADAALAPTLVQMDLTDDGWERLQGAQAYLLKVADNHDSRDLLLPCTERLISNVLKVTMLIAASRRRIVQDNTMTAQTEDLMLALFFARGWLDHLLRIVTRVGRDPFDAQTYKVLETITKAGEGGITRGAVMRNWRLSARDADAIFETLVQRGEVSQDFKEGHKTSYGAIYRASQYARTSKTTRVTAPLKVRRTTPPPTPT